MTSAARDPSSSTYDADTGQPRFDIGRLDAHEELRIPAAWPGMRGLVGLLVALPLWILAASFKFGVKVLYSGWTGVVAVAAIATCAVAVYAILQIVWWLGGSERIAIIGEDLLVRHTIVGIPIVTRSFRGRDIRFLAAVDVPRRGWLDEPLLPFASSSRCGSLKFFYSETTVYLGHDLGLVDAKRAAAWLAVRLPAAGGGDAR